MFFHLHRVTTSHPLATFFGGRLCCVLFVLQYKDLRRSLRVVSRRIHEQIMCICPAQRTLIVCVSDVRRRDMHMCKVMMLWWASRIIVYFMPCNICFNLWIKSFWNLGYDVPNFNFRSMFRQQPTCAYPENFLGGRGGGRGLALDHEGSDSFTISKPIPWEIEGGGSGPPVPSSGSAHGRCITKTFPVTCWLSLEHQCWVV